MGGVGNEGGAGKGECEEVKRGDGKKVMSTEGSADGTFLSAWGVAASGMEREREDCTPGFQIQTRREGFRHKTEGVRGFGREKKEREGGRESKELICTPGFRQNGCQRRGCCRCPSGATSQCYRCRPFRRACAWPPSLHSKGRPTVRGLRWCELLTMSSSSIYTIWQPVRLSVCLDLSVSICLSIWLSVRRSVCLQASWLVY
jgi:hypothetical protein